MNRHLFHRAPPSLADAVSEEVLSIHRASQIGRLRLSCHQRRDIGLDCPAGDQKRY